MPRIIDETEDKIVIDEKSLFGRIGIFFLGLILIYLGLNAVIFIDVGRFMIPSNIFERLYLIFLLVMFLIFGTYLLLDSLILKTTTVDRTIERVIIKKGIFIKPLKSVKEIPFLDIKEFQIEHLVDWPGTDTSGWSIKVVTNDNISEEILYKNFEPCPREIVKKIINLTGKDVRA